MGMEMEMEVMEMEMEMEMEMMEMEGWLHKLLPLRERGIVLFMFLVKECW